MDYLLILTWFLSSQALSAGSFWSFPLHQQSEHLVCCSKGPGPSTRLSSKERLLELGARFCVVFSYHDNLSTKSLYLQELQDSASYETVVLVLVPRKERANSAIRADKGWPVGKASRRQQENGQVQLECTCGSKKPRTCRCGLRPIV